MTESVAQGPEDGLDALLHEVGIDLSGPERDLAFVHRSYAYENGQIPTNERLEFLGDAVLEIHVTDYLYRSQPDLPEGRLAKVRSAVVNTHSLADVARRHGLGHHILLGRGEVTTGGADKSSILADTTEALIGAIHIGVGEQAAADFVRHVFAPLVDQAVSLGAGLDWKTALQELASANGDLPTYEVEQSGPEHQRSFTAWVSAAGARFGPGTGTTKRQAEQHAAEVAVRSLQGTGVAASR
ncbi:ribonuclease III [Parenemella sanctibonifatiensis]|uniref:Ribonuclease 3 n=1 Tax=Parenemella sanctibonifatiensis TaxID=2016505 RepID=A0A255EIL3_9ACTN|nr:ribonuclease III [Parenemella sanctibonifatiensis]OYN88202.1 ribonuclease III [Parenemella sanctibonifatiensis]OYN91368.1 ribonuclease III [Parenemella sanctibonifatiensis]